MTAGAGDAAEEHFPEEQPPDEQCRQPAVRAARAIRNPPVTCVNFAIIPILSWIKRSLPWPRYSIAKGA